MNTFRLLPKSFHPIAVLSSRPCRGSAEMPTQAGGWTGRLGMNGFARPQGGPAAADRTAIEPAAYTMHSIVLADDHAVVRQSLKRLLNQQADFHLVGESSNGLETLSLVKQLQPDLLVTDLMMPGMNGLEVTRRIRLSFPATRVIVVSVNCDEPYVAGAFRCGANGFVMKTACGRHLVPAVRAVLAGQRYLSPPLSDPMD